MNGGKFDYLERALFELGDEINLMIQQGEFDSATPETLERIKTLTYILRALHVVVKNLDLYASGDSDEKRFVLLFDAFFNSNL